MLTRAALLGFGVRLAPWLAKRIDRTSARTCAAVGFCSVHRDFIAFSPALSSSGCQSRSPGDSPMTTPNMPNTPNTFKNNKSATRPDGGATKGKDTGATPATDTPATTPKPDPIEFPGTQGVKSEPDRSKAYGPGGGTPMGAESTDASASTPATPGRTSASTTNTADIDNPAPTARPGMVDETGSRTSGEAL